MFTTNFKTIEKKFTENAHFSTHSFFTPLLKVHITKKGFLLAFFTSHSKVQAVLASHVETEVCNHSGGHRLVAEHLAGETRQTA